MRETIKEQQVSQINNEILNRLSTSIDTRLFLTLFDNGAFALVSLDNNIATFVSESESNAKIISSAFLPTISSILKDITEGSYEIEIIDKNSYSKRNKIIAENTHSFFKDSNISDKFTFDNFVTGNNNKAAYAASLFAVNSPGKHNPIFIYSNSGMGKTHLLHAIGNEYKRLNPTSNPLYITTDDFVREFVKFVRGQKDSEDLKDFFTTVDVLLVDDVQFLSGKEDTQVMFFNIFNLLVDQGKQIVLTSDRAPDELKGVQDRLVSRFSGGLTIGISHPDKNILIDILKKKITANGLDIEKFDDNVLEYLATNYNTNIRVLEGALNRILFALISENNDGHITLDFVREIFGDDEQRKSKKGKIDIDSIIEIVSSYYSLTSSQIKSKVKTNQLALARQIAMYLSRTILNATFKEIGRTFEKDHSTVMSNISKVEKMVESDPTTKRVIDDLTKKINDSIK